MKINYTMWIIEPTGGTRVLCEIINRLSKRGHDVSITTINKEIPFPLEPKINRIQTDKLSRLLRLGVAGVDKFLGFPVSVDDVLSKKMAKVMPDCDINVAHSIIDAIHIFRSEKGIPFHHMQHLEELIFQDQYGKSKAKEVAANPLINKIVNSIWLKNQMKEKYGYDSPVVNPAIDHSVFYPREVEKNANKMRILCFGKQERWKGFPEALRAMEIVMKKRKGIEFVVYGSRQPLYESNVRYTFVKFPSDDELARLYSSADIVICPSWYESFPLPPLEAMACGAPVITTRYGTEDYAFHEKNCLVFPPKNSNALANAVLRLLADEDLRGRFKKEGPKTAKQFTWDETLDKVEKLFKKVKK